MNANWQTVLGAAARGVLQSAGGGAAVAGAASGDTTTLITGAVSILAGYGWSLLQKHQAGQLVKAKAKAKKKK